jgi:putative transposase
VVNTREIAAEYRLSHWAGIMQERNESGMSIRSYCKSIGLHENVYHYWQRKLREAACTDLLPGAETAVPNGWAICESGQQSSSTMREVTIEIGKSRVSANTGTDLELLGKICRMLASLC